MKKLLAVMVVAIILLAISISYSYFRPRAVLKFENYNRTLQESLVYNGYYATFVTNLNFTITNIGNKDSPSFVIFVDTTHVDLAIPIDPIKISPIKPGETRIVTLDEYAGRGYPVLIIGQHKFYFGEEITIELD